ncbi:MAG: Y4yA family PLP-dependent enzyme [Cyclobacteriaceae bacterium]
MTTELPRLTPHVSDWMTSLTDQPQVLDGLLETYGSPVNIHHTGPFQANYAKYQAVFEAHGLDHLVCFARKANKCSGFVAKARDMGIGVDTASYHELEECLSMGLNPEKLVLTAAIKNRKLIHLAVKAGVLIILDNEDECALTQQVAEELHVTARIGLRICGFEYEGEKLYSRFGFVVSRVADFLKEHFGSSGIYNKLEYSGLHFHLNGYSTSQRGTALQQSLQLAEHLTGLGFRTSFIDIGGGFLMNYLQHKTEWEHFLKHLKKAVKGEADPITFQNNGLGYEIVDGKLHGKLNTYPYFNEQSQDVFLEEILSYESGGESNAQYARRLNIQMRMEPGRSLLDQTGMTVAKVAFRKKDMEGHWLVGLEMNMTQIYSSSADFLLDPFYLPLNTSSEAQPTEVYFTGAYCLERDVLLKRKIALPQLPEIGDIVIFVNTAGYMMHFFETEAHMFRLATNLFYHKGDQAAELSDFAEDTTES